MVVSPDGEINGQFNILFKPLPQFDDKNVVFGRVSDKFIAQIEKILKTFMFPPQDTLVRLGIE